MNKLFPLLLFLCAFSNAFARPSFSSSRSFSSPSRPSTPSASRPSFSASRSSSSPVPAARPSAAAKSSTSWFGSSKKEVPVIAAVGVVAASSSAPDRAAQSAQTVAQSKAKYETYKASQEVPKWSSKYKVESKSYWVDRDQRENIVYKNYYTRPPVQVVYRDNFSPFFWLWLMDQSIESRASWAYNHRSEMDDRRYQDLLAKDTALETKVQELEANKGTPDKNYTPEGLDTDLMYDKDKIKEIKQAEKAKIKDDDFDDANFLWICGGLALLITGGLFYSWKRSAR